MIKLLLLLLFLAPINFPSFPAIEPDLWGWEALEGAEVYEVWIQLATDHPDTWHDYGETETNRISIYGIGNYRIRIRGIGLHGQISEPSDPSDWRYP